MKQHSEAKDVGFRNSQRKSDEWGVKSSIYQFEPTERKSIYYPPTFDLHCVCQVLFN